MTLLEQRLQYDEQNLECARIILADRERYAGLPVIWAEAVMARLGYLALPKAA